jgi:flavin reductase (DIM6/NTAB) family NADH-FMN oxidoreductase RutF
MGRAHLVVTVDAQGRPHPAMLSHGELLATGPNQVLVATYRSSTAANNMRRNGHFTLCLVDAGMAYYVKGRAAELPPMEDFPKLARFQVQVEQVLEDYSQAEIEGEARVLGGITFTVGDATERWLGEWERLLKVLPAP